MDVNIITNPYPEGKYLEGKQFGLFLGKLLSMVAGVLLSLTLASVYALPLLVSLLHDYDARGQGHKMEAEDEVRKMSENSDVSSESADRKLLRKGFIKGAWQSVAFPVVLGGKMLTYGVANLCPEQRSFEQSQQNMTWLSNSLSALFWRCGMTAPGNEERRWLSQSRFAPKPAPKLAT